MPQIRDTFGPLLSSSAGLKYFDLPKSVNVHLIDTEDKIDLIHKLNESGDEPIGIDSEWRPPLNVFHQTLGPSIIQLSDSKNAFIIDVISLEDKIDRLTTHVKKALGNRLLVGFGF